MKFLGVDIGTSFIKTALLDLQSFEIRDIKKAKAPDVLRAENPKAREYDVEEIYRTVLGLMESYSHEAPQLHGIVFSTQMHGFVLADRELKSITRYISWQDERALESAGSGDGSYVDAVCGLLEEKGVLHSGMKPKAGYAVCSLYYIMQSNQVSLQQEAVFCTLGDYIIARLTKEQPCSHITNAASTGLTDLTEGGWNRQAMDTFGFCGITFPGIVKEDHLCGTLIWKGHKIPVFPAVGDHQAAVLGAGILPSEELSINIGTGSQIGIIDTRLKFGNYQTRPFFEDRYLKTISSIPAGRALNVLLNFIAGIGRDFFEASEAQLAGLWKQMDEKVAGLCGSDLEVKLSFFQSSLKESRGMVANIGESNLTAENLLYAAYANMAENYWKFYRQMEDGEPVIQKIVLSGGLARKNTVLRKLIAEKFGLETKLCLHTEDTMAGLFRIAMKCAGICNTLDEAGKTLHRVKVIE